MNGAARIARFCLLFSLLFSGQLAASPGRTIADGSRAVVREAQRYARDARAIALAPKKWERGELTRAAMAVGSIAAAALVDDRLDEWVRDHPSERRDRISDAVTPFGGGRGEQLSLALLFGGVALDRDSLRDTGRDAFESQLLAAHLVTPLLKRAIGRERPNRNAGVAEFDPFGGGESFPSGHATSAFALAAVLSAHSKGRIVPALSWTIASMVAASRVNDRAHFLSDVVAGGLIGAGIGRAVVRLHANDTKASKFFIAPSFDGDGVGVQIRVRL